MLKLLQKGENINIGPCEETNNVQSIYLAFQKLKNSTKKGQRVSESSSRLKSNMISAADVTIN